MSLQPLLELRGFTALLLVRVEIGGIHERLDALHHGAQKGKRPPDKRNTENRVMLLREFQFFGFDHQFAVLVPDNNGLLVRAAHIDALDQRLTADRGTETAGGLVVLLLFRHSLLPY